ncbi:hypothetical protein FRB94_005317 [Tulasnella sp. JGI-2019a]|nr:hypothetical protein FRB94_005317 [Tulasnella sp. JGI-2019a]
MEAVTEVYSVIQRLELVFLLRKWKNSENPLFQDLTIHSFICSRTLAEFTLSTSSGVDYYDVSLVDGFNIPISITFTTASYCSIASCPVDLNANCPAALKGPLDSNGVAVGCKSDCTVDPNPSDSPSCCSGTHATPATCPPSGVPNYNYFKQNCPNSYVYAYDESSGTALQTCPSTTSADYTITFCPTA